MRNVTGGGFPYINVWDRNFCFSVEYYQAMPVCGVGSYSVSLVLGDDRCWGTWFCLLDETKMSSIVERVHVGILGLIHFFFPSSIKLPMSFLFGSPVTSGTLLFGGAYPTVWVLGCRVAAVFPMRFAGSVTATKSMISLRASYVWDCSIVTSQINLLKKAMNGCFGFCKPSIILPFLPLSGPWHCSR